MRKETAEKMREGAEAYRQERAAMRQRRLVVGPWMVYRADEWNLVVQKGEDGEQFFYPDFAAAVRSLFRKMSEPTGKHSAADLARHMDKCEKAIVEAVRRAGGLAGLFAGAGDGAA